MNKSRILITLLSLFPIFIISCGNKNLTKEDAKKQIDEFLIKESNKSTFCLDCDMENRYMQDEHVQMDGWSKLANAGYIKISNTVTRENYYGNINEYPSQHLELLEKAKPFYIKTDQAPGWTSGGHPGYFCKTGVLEAEITSITEPAPTNGNIVCNVNYVAKFTPNDFYKTYGSEGSQSDSKRTATFIKMQDGWKLNDRE